jgi:hypothetical protein
VLTLLRRAQRSLTLALALVGPLVIAAVLSPFRGSFADTAAALVLVASVVALAVTGGRRAGYVASLASALWFDFFLTRPYDRFAISHRPDIETTVAIVLVGVLVTELAARSRRHARTSSEGFGYVETFQSFSDLAAGPTPSPQIIEFVSTSLVELLDLRACRFERLGTDPPLARVLANGVVDHVGLAWPRGRDSRGVAREGLGSIRHHADARCRGLGRTAQRGGVARDLGGRGARSRTSQRMRRRCDMCDTAFARCAT